MNDAPVDDSDAPAEALEADFWKDADASADLTRLRSMGGSAGGSWVHTESALNTPYGIRRVEGPGG